MQGVRGQNKSPGEFRNTQNWIGSKSGRMEEATFIPPDPLVITEYLEKRIYKIRDISQMEPAKFAAAINLLMNIQNQ